MAHPDFVESQKCYVSIYEKNQAYGGPEEGGWWHTTYKLMGSVPFLSGEAAEAYLEQAKAQAAGLQREANQQFREYYDSRFSDSDDIQDDFCVGESASADEYLVRIEDVLGELDNSDEPIPHWE